MWHQFPDNKCFVFGNSWDNVGYRQQYILLTITVVKSGLNITKTCVTTQSLLMKGRVSSLTEDTYSAQAVIWITIVHGTIRMIMSLKMHLLTAGPLPRLDHAPFGICSIVFQNAPNLLLMHNIKHRSSRYVSPFSITTTPSILLGA